MIDFKTEKPEISFTRNGNIRVTFETSKTILKSIDGLPDKPLTVTVKEFKPERSRDANAYFHLLVSKIAEAMNLGADEVKVNMVLEHGTVARDEFGEKVGVMLPLSVNVKNYYKYSLLFDTRTVNGKEFNCYIFYKETHLYDSKEMARLIDGVVSEAKELGIETKTPQELEQLAKDWETVRGKNG